MGGGAIQLVAVLMDDPIHGNSTAPILFRCRGNMAIFLIVFSCILGVYEYTRALAASWLDVFTTSGHETRVFSFARAW